MANLARDFLTTKIISDITFESSEKDFNIIASRVKAIQDTPDIVVLLTQSESSSTNMLRSIDKAQIL